MLSERYEGFKPHFERIKDPIAKLELREIYALLLRAESLAFKTGLQTNATDLASDGISNVGNTIPRDIKEFFELDMSTGRESRIKAEVTPDKITLQEIETIRGLLRTKEIIRRIIEIDTTIDPESPEEQINAELTVEKLVHPKQESLIKRLKGLFKSPDQQEGFINTTFANFSDFPKSTVRHKGSLSEKDLALGDKSLYELIAALNERMKRTLEKYYKIYPEKK